MEHEDEEYTDGMDGFISDLSNAIPGIDEAMSFGEMLKYASSFIFNDMNTDNICSLILSAGSECSIVGS